MATRQASQSHLHAGRTQCLQIRRYDRRFRLEGPLLHPGRHSKICFRMSKLAPAQLDLVIPLWSSVISSSDLQYQRKMYLTAYRTILIQSIESADYQQSELWLARAKVQPAKVQQQHETTLLIHIMTKFSIEKLGWCKYRCLELLRRISARQAENFENQLPPYRILSPMLSQASLSSSGLFFLSSW